MRNASDYERVPTNGVTLAVHEHGSGKPVVLCHGWPEMGWSWRHQVGPLAAAGYRAIVPNQRGYWLSDRPEPVEDYDINALTGDLVGLLDHYGEERAVFVGHDWGAIVVWALAQLHPDRVAGVVNLSVPFMQRGPTEWVGFWESQLGGDFYIVHFNRQPGVADAAFEENTRQFLRNIYRAEQWKEPAPPAQPGMPLINLARQAEPRGKAFMDDLAHPGGRAPGRSDTEPRDLRPVRRGAEVTDPRAARSERRGAHPRVRPLDPAGEGRRDERADAGVARAALPGVAAFGALGEISASTPGRNRTHFGETARFSVAGPGRCSAAPVWARQQPRATFPCDAPRGGSACR